MNDKPQMTDVDLDRLLAFASAPEGGSHGMAELLGRISAPRPSRRLVWPALVPLAASLMLGLYLGASGMDATFSPVDDAITYSDDGSSDIEDIEAIAESSQS